MEEQQSVSAREILEAAGADKPVTGGTYLQRTGLFLAASVEITGALVTFALIANWVVYAPHAPSISPGIDPATVKAMLQNYKSLQQIAFEPTTTLFDSVVIKALLPIFRSILGYIFGSRGNNGSA
jgi:hypothetical protein